MRVLIIEDEKPAARNLSRHLLDLRPGFEVLDVLDSVSTAVAWFEQQPEPDLVFMDIQLADGLSFDIFTQVELKVPVIFTTAFDQYTLKAFKVNSIDYLLKPIDPEELDQAIRKFEKLRQPPSAQTLQQLIQAIQKPDYKERFLVKSGQQLIYLPVQSIAYFFSEDGLVFAQQESGKKYVLDFTLDQLEKLLDPEHYFRINRKFILKLSAIQKIHTYFNNRLKLEIHPDTGEVEVIVSRDRVNDFKQWLDS
jgi:DNA-binding LytR/AlgR family response regulator